MPTTDEIDRDRRLAGRRIFLTGAASGIGRAIALLFASEGARLALFDVNAEALADTAAATGASCTAGDVRNEAEVAHAVDAAVSALGGLDGVVNAAGVITIGPVTETDLAAWDRVIGINLTGPFLVCRAAVPHLKAATGATIVNISSAQAFRPTANSCSYAASKAGVMNFTKALAAELAPGIRANVVCPGIVDTPMVAGVSKAAGTKPTVPVVADYPLGRMAAPEEIAEAVLFLSSRQSSYVTGAALAVDGGRSFH